MLPRRVRWRSWRSSGLIWGVGAILFGRGIDLLGVGLSMPIMLGLTNVIGTLMPVVLRDPGGLLTASGLG